MNITIKEQDTVAIVALSDSILYEDIIPIRNRLHDLANNKKPNIVLNMQHVSYISSMVLVALIDIKSILNRQNGDIKLARANDFVKNLLEITKLNNKIENYESVEDACEAFG